MTTIYNDIKYAFRQLRKSPGFTAVVILTLAICLGANIAIFAVVDAILLRPLPFPKPERLVCVFNSYPGAGMEHSFASIANYFDRREAIQAFGSVSIYQDASVIVGGTESVDRVQIMRISPDFFQTLGMPLAMGKNFTEEELTYEADRVAILTDGFWRSRFNADPDVLGSTFLNDGLPVTVVGVLPRDFRFLSSRARFFRPASHAAEEHHPYRRHNNEWNMIARLAPDATLADAQAQIDALNIQETDELPYAKQIKATGFHSVVRLLHDDHVRTVKPIISLLQAGVLVLLLIGSVNLVNLLLIRAHGQAKALAVRQALGAGRLTLAREVLAETLLIGVGGGIGGLLLGVTGVRFLRVLGTDQLPLGASVTFDGRIAAVALATAIVIGALLAMPIIWFNLRKQLTPALQSEARGSAVNPAAQRLRHGFIVAQIALAFMLLTGAGLLGVSLRRVLAVSPGFQPEQVLSAHLGFPKGLYQDNASRLAFNERLLSELRAQPGVAWAALSTCGPFTPQATAHQTAITPEGVTPKPGESLSVRTCSWIAGDYWQTLGVPLRTGRLLDESDEHREQRVCVVDEAFAQCYWPQGNAIGHRLAENSSFKEDEGFTIVGVVGDVKVNDLVETSIVGAVYFPYQYNSKHDNINVFIRTRLAPATLAPILQKTVQQLDPELAVDDIRPMQARIDDSLVARRSPAILAALFSGFALLLSALGTYGVIAYAVSGRRREIGVRLALGAQPGQVCSQFLRIGMRLLLTGLVPGVIGAWIAGCAMRSVLFEVSTPLHGVLFGVIALVMGTCSLAACYIPARRAAKTDPMDVLRYE